MTTKQETRYHIRWMLRVDMPEVVEITDTGDLWPRTETEILGILSRRNTIGMVAEHGAAVVGFMIYELHKTHLNLLKLVVHPEHRLRGVGRQMVAKLAGKLSSQRRRAIRVEVHESDLSALLFLRSQGFLATAVLRDHYDDIDDDAIIMMYQHKETTNR